MLRHYSRSSKCMMLALCLLIFATWECFVRASSPGGMILRIRMGDGSMERVQVPPGGEDTMTLQEILQSLPVGEGSSIQVGSVSVSDDDSAQSTLAGLGLKHGSLITISAPLVAGDSKKPTESRFSQLKQDSNRWDPFPDLAKNYEQALLKTKTRRSSQKGMSYGDIAHLQSSLHVVEPQPEGALKRVYMCRFSAERFQTNGITKKGGDITARVGLLFGTIQRERVDKHKPKKARTSLSSQVSEEEYCTVAKVQAVWEPPRQEPQKDVYDVKMSQKLLDVNPRVMEIADHLGLIPVGWIFSYKGNRHEDEEALPILGLDVQTGSMIQIANMRARDRIEGAKFVTLAMDASTGATEAFQLSDVSVQMVAEGILVTKGGNDPTTVPSERHIPLKRAALVDGKETKKLDSVLCLVNTAMLSHEGNFAGKSAISSVKKNGSLTNKAKKALRATLDDDARLLQELCDLNTLVALDQALTKEDSTELCQLVRKRARGQKLGTKVDSKLKMHLQSILET